ncbi:MAG: class I SAM-dependent methyltransferase [Anaerolineae bacterium]
MTKFQDIEYLKTRQYAGADKLAARIRLHQLFSTNNMSVHRWQFDRILAVSSRNILEVGSGRGDLWKVNAERIPASWHITLTDLSAGMLADCRAHLGETLAQRFTFEPVDVQALPYADASFDVIIANYMLYHVPDRPKAIAELRRVLKPDGVLFAMTNGLHHMQEFEQLIDEVVGRENRTPYLMGVREAFTLQNGAEQLRASFAQVEREDFEGNLRVTQLEPLLDYIASALDHPEVQMKAPRAQALIAELDRRIKTDGEIFITKETGLFTVQGIP